MSAGTTIVGEHRNNIAEESAMAFPPKIRLRGEVLL